MENKDLNKVKAIAAQYEQKTEAEKSIEKLARLDKKAKLPAEVFAYAFGSIGALVLGIGMCLAMKVIFNAMALGIAIGLVGIAMVTVTYPLYKKILASRKKKYGSEILRISGELLSENA